MLAADLGQANVLLRSGPWPPVYSRSPLRQFFQASKRLLPLAIGKYINRDIRMFRLFGSKKARKRLKKVTKGCT
jgi:hypothetical protein